MKILLTLVFAIIVGTVHLVDPTGQLALEDDGSASENN